MSQVGRNTQGVTIIRTIEDERVVALQRIDEIEELETSEEEGETVATNEAEQNSDSE
ncbi:DNA gyrase subunit A [Vibrio ishigakensis]|uniref:DNA gyrase subunit A n=1 Tax=Vibrio ishigakensis TaxID=1481914 RepID=A0A0B8P8F5_9VIBR|nr:DNA gyrase subunit A [Vibrio ishigakensis]